MLQSGSDADADGCPAAHPRLTKLPAWGRIDITDLGVCAACSLLFVAPFPMVLLLVFLLAQLVTHWTLLAGWAALEAMWWVHRRRLIDAHQPWTAAEIPAPSRGEAMKRFLKLKNDAIPDFHAFISGWFRGADPADLKRENLREFVRNVLYGAPALHSEGVYARATGGEQHPNANAEVGDVRLITDHDEAEIEKFICEVEKTWGIVFESGRTDGLIFMAHTREPVRAWRRYNRNAPQTHIFFAIHFLIHACISVCPSVQTQLQIWHTPLCLVCWSHAVDALGGAVLRKWGFTRITDVNGKSVGNAHASYWIINAPVMGDTSGAGVLTTAAAAAAEVTTTDAEREWEREEMHTPSTPPPWTHQGGGGGGGGGNSGGGNSGSVGKGLSRWLRPPLSGTSRGRALSPGNARPVVFFHGLGVGLPPYLWTVAQLLRSNPARSLVLVCLPHISLQACAVIPAPGTSSLLVDRSTTPHRGCCHSHCYFVLFCFGFVFFLNVLFPSVGARRSHR